MSDELEVKISPVVDDGEPARSKFQIGLHSMIAKIKNIPKIALSLDKEKTRVNFQNQIGSILKNLKVEGIDLNLKTTVGNINTKIPQTLKEQKIAFRELEEAQKLQHQKAMNNIREEYAQKLNLLKLETKEKTSKKSTLANAVNTNQIDTKIYKYEQDVAKYKKLGINISSVESELNAAKIANIGFINSFNSNNLSEASKRYAKLNIQLKAIGNNLSKFSKQSSTHTTLNKNEQGLRNLILEMQTFAHKNDKLFRNSDFSKDYNQIFSETKNALSKGNFGELDKLTGKYKTLKSEIFDVGETGQTTATRLKDQISKLGVYFSATAIFMTLSTQIRRTINDVVDLDKCITDLQIATGYSRDKTRELLNGYSDLGKEIGATTTKVAQASDDWLRQGYSINEANTLIKNSMMLSKLGKMEAADATTALTSAMKGYSVEVENSIEIVDKFTSVDMKAAVNAGYIATAMAETATSAKLAGVDINKLIGYITTIGEVTQDGAESVGNFAKTLFARMGNIKAGKLFDPETSESLKTWAFIA